MQPLEPILSLTDKKYWSIQFIECQGKVLMSVVDHNHVIESVKEAHRSAKFESEWANINLLEPKEAAQLALQIIKEPTCTTVTFAPKEAIGNEVLKQFNSLMKYETKKVPRERTILDDIFDHC